MTGHVLSKGFLYLVLMERLCCSNRDPFVITNRHAMYTYVADVCLTGHLLQTVSCFACNSSTTLQLGLRELKNMRAV